MKVITAYVQPFMLEKVTDALRLQKNHGVTVVQIQCEWFGPLIDGNTSHYEDPAVDLGYAPKARVEVVCRDEEAQGIVQTIRDSAHTGRHGDGRIFVAEVTRAVDIRTGAEGEAIL